MNCNVKINCRISKTTWSVVKTEQVKQPETVAVMKWLAEYPFVLSANLHGGALVANYPFDDNQDMHPEGPNNSPDNEVFIMLAKTYSEVSIEALSVIFHRQNLICLIYNVYSHLHN